MQNAIQTGFHDKTGRALHVDDVVQHRLGKNGKSSGPTNLKIIAYGKKFHFVSETHTNPHHGGVPITDKVCQYVVVIRCDHFRG